MANTEKPTTKQEAKKTAPAKPAKEIVNKAPVKEEKKKEINAEEKKVETKKPEKKQDIKPKIKKTEARVVGRSLPISTKYAVSICKFVKNKKIEQAISDLEQVLAYKKSIPMKGEIPHRKGKNMSSGRYPKKACENFIKLIKSLQANTNANELENPIIVEAVANKASRPFGRFGRIKRKRTHVTMLAKEKKTKGGKK